MQKHRTHLQSSPNQIRFSSTCVLPRMKNFDNTDLTRLARMHLQKPSPQADINKQPARPPNGARGSPASACASPAISEFNLSPPRRATEWRRFYMKTPRTIVASAQTFFIA